MTQHLSEVARIRAQISAEYMAARNGLSGMAITARHDFINSRMEKIGQLQKELAKFIEPLDALQMIHEASLDAVEQPAETMKEVCDVVG